MLKNYLVVAFRNIRRNPLRTFVHVTGLALGVAVCSVVFQVVYHEYTFDTFHPDSDRIYQVTTTTGFLGESVTNGGVPIPLAHVIADEVAGIEQKTFFYTLWDVNVHNPETDDWFPNQPQVTYADPDLLRIFPRTWLAGDPAAALSTLNQVVLTESAAKQYFPEQPANRIIGKFLEYYFLDTLTVEVVGVVADFEENSDFLFTDFLSVGNLFQERSKDYFSTDQWNNINSSSQLFLKLSENKTPEDLEVDFERIEQKYLTTEDGIAMEFSLSPLSELHFYQNFDRPAANKAMLFGLMVIGGIMLLLAGMNFINLETAQSVLRAKEVGIRKTMGSNRRQLVMQSIVETGLLVIIAISFGIVGSELLVIYFHEFLPTGLDIQYRSWQGLAFFASIFLFLTIFSGIFPALLLAAYSPRKTLGKDFRIPQGFSFGYLIQRYLTIFQFACAIMFVVGVLVVSDQVHYLTKRELGFETERILFARLPFSQVTPEAKRSLQVSIEQQAFVQQTSYASDMLASSGLWTSVIEVPTAEGTEELSVQVKAIDEDFMDLFGVPIIQGKNLRAESKQLLVNETLHNQLSNLQRGSLIGETVGYRDEVYTIVGIVPDVHTRTLREPILPMIYHHGTINSNTLNVKVMQGNEISSAKRELDQLFSTYFPLETAGFGLLEHELATFYEWDLKLGKILTMASLMAILISLLGLFALTSLIIAKKSKEISIRKVLGASVQQLLLEIAKSYMVLMLMAVILGSIPAWMLAERWLADFAFRIPMPIHLFVYAGLLITLLALLIVSVHGIKVASRNPSEVLKGE